MLLLTHVLVLCVFLSFPTLVLSEALLWLQQALSARVFAVALSAALCWLVLDNLVLGSDLWRATRNISTDCERELLRRLARSNQGFNLVHRRLDEEAAQHRETAARLDRLEDGSLAVMHWRMLAAKTAAINNAREIILRRERCCFARNLKRSMSEGRSF